MHFRNQIISAAILLVFANSCLADGVEQIFERVAQHAFQPLNEDGSFTSDRHLEKHGIANLNDQDWRIRLLSIRDLLRLLPEHEADVQRGLTHLDQHVRQITAAALGIARNRSSSRALEQLLDSDASALVRSQAAMSLGQLESTGSIEMLRAKMEGDPSRDVRHQCELALDQISKRAGASEEQLRAFLNLDESQFELLQVGKAAPNFSLNDTEGTNWSVSEQRGKWVVLVWIFADWCPVCHGEFNDLISMKNQFERANTVVATLECHDRYRCRLMVGKETDAEYWFAKSSFQSKYRQRIWWPHLSDLAGRVGANYGVDPMAFAVHAEYINRPSTIIIDPEGIVRFAYYGTFWGDRPTMHETLQMIKRGEFDFVHERRLGGD